MITKLNFRSDVIKYSDNFFKKFFINFFLCIKLSKNLSAKYYQENKERLHKKLVKDIKVFPKKKNKKATI